MLIQADFTPLFPLIRSVFPLDGAEKPASYEAAGTGGQTVNIMFREGRYMYTYLLRAKVAKPESQTDKRLPERQTRTSPCKTNITTGLIEIRYESNILDCKTVRWGPQ